MLGRRDIDRQGSSIQFLTVEDTVCAVHACRGWVGQVSSKMLSEIAVITRMPRRVLGKDRPRAWEAFEENCDSIRDAYFRRGGGVRSFGGFIPAHPPREEHAFPPVARRRSFSTSSTTPIPKSLIVRLERVPAPVFA